MKTFLNSKGFIYLKKLLIVVGLFYGLSFVAVFSLEGFKLSQTLSQTFLSAPQLLIKKITLSLSDNAGLEIPLYKGKLPSGKLIKQQWQEGENFFVFVAVHELESHKGPNLASPIHEVLKGSQRVRVNYISQAKLRVDDEKTNWVFVSDESGKAPLGWVPKSALGFQNQFEKVSVWNYDNLGFCRAELCAEYHIAFDGHFKTNWGSQGQALYLSGTHQGKMFRYKQVFYGKKTEPGLPLDIFYLDANKVFSQEFKYGYAPVRAF